MVNAPKAFPKEFRRDVVAGVREIALGVLPGVVSGTAPEGGSASKLSVVAVPD
jgi:hypothetical protein